MEQSIWSDFLVNQAPSIVIIGVFCYGTYKYFTAQQEKKDNLIAQKDSQIAAQTKEATDLYGKAIEAHTKSNMLQEQLMDLLKEIKTEIHAK
jgi:hypothetical protein